MHKARSNQLQFFCSRSNISGKHFLVAFEATTCKHDLLTIDIRPSAILLPDLDTTDLTIIVHEQFLCLGLPVHIKALVLREMREQAIDDSIATTFRESEVLICVELEKDIFLLVVVELHAMFDEVFCRDCNTQ